MKSTRILSAVFMIFALWLFAGCSSMGDSYPSSHSASGGSGGGSGGY